MSNTILQKASDRRVTFPPVQLSSWKTHKLCPGRGPEPHLGHGPAGLLRQPDCSRRAFRCLILTVVLSFINPAPWTPGATSDSHCVCSPCFPQACYVSESEAGLELLDPLSTTLQGEGLQTLLSHLPLAYMVSV